MSPQSFPNCRLFTPFYAGNVIPSWQNSSDPFSRLTAGKQEETTADSSGAIQYKTRAVDVDDDWGCRRKTDARWR